MISFQFSHSSYIIGDTSLALSNSKVQINISFLYCQIKNIPSYTIPCSSMTLISRLQEILGDSAAEKLKSFEAHEAKSLIVVIGDGPEYKGRLLFREKKHQ